MYKLTFNELKMQTALRDDDLAAASILPMLSAAAARKKIDSIESEEQYHNGDRLAATSLGYFLRHTTWHYLTYYGDCVYLVFYMNNFPISARHFYIQLETPAERDYFWGIMNSERQLWYELDETDERVQQTEG